ncbi:MAG: LysR family transcriptional regulator [Pseudomonadota bacterium]
MPISGIEVFLTIVREGSLRAAARALGVGAPAVSLQLKALEASMGVGLLHRSTRRIGLTEAGKVLFESAAPAYRDLLYATKKTREIGTSLTGTLRLSVSQTAYSQALEPVLGKFLEDNSGINLDISWSEALVDFTRDRFHAGIRLGDVLAPEMVAVRLTPPLESTFLASPSYLTRNGRPDHPQDLFRHQCIRHRYPSADRLTDWRFTEGGQEKRISPPARLTFDTMAGVIQAVRRGHGIGWSLRMSVEEHLRCGELETVLDSFGKALPPFYLYYPEQNKRVECLRLLIDCLKTYREKGG